MATSVSGITHIVKRDGRVVPFEARKIEAAIGKAFAATGAAADAVPAGLAQLVVDRLSVETPPTVEQVQDAVEEVLMAASHPAVAKAFILYRQKRHDVREVKHLLGVDDELKLTVNAVKVLERRYLLRDADGRLAESPAQLFRRVAKAVAAPEAKFGGNPVEAEEAFYAAMSALEFLPNSPTLMNAGTDLGQLAACFVIPVEDSMGAIFDAVKSMALIHQSGGGTGFSFSRLRPKGDLVRSTHGVASGPVSFMRVFDTGTDVIKQGGKRRGANMGILAADHPDILEFIQAKSKDDILSNFNVSVGATDEFMQAVLDGDDYGLYSPRTGERVKRLSALHVFDLICTEAWKSGDPGLIFIDEINRHNPTPQLGAMEATNPCGELPLLPYESCNLGSVNLSKVVRDGQMDWEKLRKLVHLGVRFLDNVLEVNRYPLPEIEAITRGNRKIGLGVMGFADALILLGIPYNSEEGLAFGGKLMAFVQGEARKASEELARIRGVFPNFEGSVYRETGPKLRNATVTSIAPTGTISIIAGCSSGIEPLFALSYVRNVMEGVKLLEVNPLFEKAARERGFFSTEVMSKVARTGGVRDLPEVPEELRWLFVTDFDIAPSYHVRMQAAFQEHCDNAVSKTINLPHEATVDDVRSALLLAHKLKCKGITVFRDGSKGQQVLYRGGATTESGEVVPFVSASSEYAGGCPGPSCEF